MAIGKLTLLYWSDKINGWTKDKTFTKSEIRRMIKEIIRLRNLLDRQGIHYHKAPKPSRVQKLGKLVDGMD